MTAQCSTCHLRLDSIDRDEARLSTHHVLHRCPDCGHIVIYKSSGFPDLTEPEIADLIVRLAAIPRPKPNGIIKRIGTYLGA